MKEGRGQPLPDPKQCVCKREKGASSLGIGSPQTWLIMEESHPPNPWLGISVQRNTTLFGTQKLGDRRLFHVHASLYLPLLSPTQDF